MAIQTTVDKVLVGRLKPGGDLANEVNRLLAEHKVRFGMVSIIGALERATLGAYSFSEAQYHTFELDEEVEILHCTGNISVMADGSTFAHLHTTVSGHSGQALGGHVFEGCVVKVAECIVQAFAGEPPVREEDPQTGLKLWKPED